jgi:hypothetical protein
LAVDALEHPGPADKDRAEASDPGICTPAGLMPGINPATYITDAGAAAANLLATIATYPHVPAEPPLACYVTGSCGQSAAPGASSQAKAKCKKRKQKKHKRVADSAKKKHKKCKRKHKKKRH